MNYPGNLIAAIILSSVAAVACAQPAEWPITPYAWIAGYDGPVGVPGTGAGRVGRVDIDTGSLSENMRLGDTMLNVSWRSGRCGTFGDCTHADVEPDDSTPFTTLYAGVEVKTKSNIVQIDAALTGPVIGASFQF